MLGAPFTIAAASPRSPQSSSSQWPFTAMRWPEPLRQMIRRPVSKRAARKRHPLEVAQAGRDDGAHVIEVERAARLDVELLQAERGGSTLAQSGDFPAQNVRVR